MTNNLLPNPNYVMAVQHWEQPTDLSQAKHLLGRLLSSITHQARHTYFHPQSKIQNVLMLAHTASIMVISISKSN